MKTVLELFDLEKTAGMYGVEVEMEGEGFPTDMWNNPLEGWRADEDGSLKAEECVEFVMTSPEGLLNTAKLLKDLYEYLEDTSIWDSHRAGVHVHVNMQKYNMKQVFTFAALYYVWEKVLINFCGENRVGHHFCLGISDTDYMVDVLKNTITDKKIYYLSDDNIRYSALNFNSLSKYGSLEFRALNTPSSPKKIIDWLKILHNLLKYSEEFNTPKDILKTFSLEGVNSFTEKCFSKKIREKVLYEGYERDILGNLRTIQDFVFCTDWELDKSNNNIFKAGEVW